MFDPLRKTAFGRFQVAGVAMAAAPTGGCYAISTEGRIAKSLLGDRATFVCDTYYAISDLDGSIAMSLLGDRATFEH